MENINSTLDYDAAITEIGCTVLEVSATDGDHMDRHEILMQVVDGCQYNIYNKYHGDILLFSMNADYALDMELVGNINHLSAAEVVHSLAFWALYADVREWVDSYFEAVEDGRIDLDEE